MQNQQRRAVPPPANNNNPPPPQNNPVPTTQTATPPAIVVTTTIKVVADTLKDFCAPTYSWAANNKGQNPCVIARILMDGVKECYDAAYYPLDSLANKVAHYPIPSAQQASPCTCSMAVYNMIQACYVCQSKESEPLATPFDAFVAHCTQFPRITYPAAIPAEVTLPLYGLTDNQHGSFDIDSAYKLVTGHNMTPPVVFILSTSTSLPQTATIPPLLDLPSSTFVYIVPVSTSIIVPEITPEYNNPPDHKAAIIAGVIVVLLAAGISTLIALWMQRQRQKRTQLRGVRLGSSLDLPEGGKDQDSPFEKPGVQDSVSLFLPSESFLSSRSSISSRNSDTYTYTTNSSSSGSHHFAPSITDSAFTYTASNFSRTITDCGSSFVTNTTEGEDLNTDEDVTSPFADRHSVTISIPSLSSSSIRTLSSPSTVGGGLLTPPPAFFHPRFSNRYSSSTLASSADTRSIHSESTTGAVYGRDETERL